MPAIHEPLNSTNALTAAEPIIARITKRFRFRADDGDDAKQECRLAILRALPTFDPARGGFNKFANMVIRNALTDFRRKLEADHRQADTLPDAILDSSGAEPDLLNMLIANPEDYLTIKQAVLIELFAVSDDHAEFAESLGCSPARASERLSRVARHLRELASN